MLCLLIITERSFFSALIQKRRDESKHFSVPAANGKEKKIVLTYRDIIIGKPLDGPAPAKVRIKRTTMTLIPNQQQEEMKKETILRRK